jgi:hypothetical protein
MQLEPQLADVHTGRTVLDDTVILVFAKNGLANAVLSQILRLAMKGSLREVAQQISKFRRLLEASACGDPFDQLPAIIPPKFWIHFLHQRLIHLRLIRLVSSQVFARDMDC